MINRRLIEKYLFGELTEQNKSDFESKLTTNNELQKEFLLSKNLNNAILEQDVMQLRSTMHTLMNNYSKEKRPLYKIIFWPVAAAVISLMVIIYFFANRINNTIDPQILFAEYYQSYPASVVIRKQVDLNLQNQIYYNAFLNYENNHFEEAIQLFKEIINNDSTEVMAAYYLAISQIEVGDFSNAKQNLVFLTQKNGHLFYEQSMWYLALVNLKLQNFDDVKRLLEEISLKNQYNTNQAKSLLKKID